MTNDSGILPMEYKVLVKPIEVATQTEGGLFLPDTTKEKDEYARTEGTLIAASPLAFGFDDWPEGSTKPSPGDRVMFARYNAHSVTGKDGHEYWLMNDRSIEAIKT